MPSLFVIGSSIMAIIVISGLILFGLTLLRIYRRQCYPPEYKIYLEYIDTKKLGPYYVSLSQKLGLNLLYDEQEGPLVKNPTDGILHYHAVSHAHQALANYEVFLSTGKTEFRDVFLNAARSIAVHGRTRSDGALVYESDVKSFAGQRTPWLSAMAQGQVIMVFCRAFAETGETDFLELAKQASVPFFKDVADGGVRSINQYRGTFYEEYAYWEQGKQHHTLNGMMSALMGLYDLWKVTEDQQYRALFEEGIKTIRNNLCAYDFPFCSSYDLRHEHCESPLFQSRYNAVHVAHLQILNAMTNDSFFDEVAQRWDAKPKSRFNRLCLFAWYLSWKARDIHNDAILLGSWYGAFCSNFRRLFTRFR